MGIIETKTLIDHFDPFYPNIVIFVAYCLS